MWFKYLFQENICKQFLTLLSSIAFILLTIGILVAYNCPAFRYEVSIYESTPILYWVALIFGIATVFVLIISEMVFVTTPKYLTVVKWILFGVCIVSITTLLITRGYYGYNFNGDTGTHIGYIKYALSSGAVDVIYPNLYIHTLCLSLLSMLDIIPLTNITPALFVLMFIIGIYLLAREVLPHKKMVTLSVFTAGAIPFGVVSNYTGSLPLPCYIPYTAGLLIFTPFCIYVLFKIANGSFKNKSYLIIATLFFISLLFYHILAWVAVLIFFAIFIVHLIYNREKYANIGGTLRSLFIILGATAVSWTFWIIMLNYLRIPVRGVYNILVGELGTIYSEKISVQYEQASILNLFDAISIVIEKFGSSLLILFIIALTFPIVYIGYKKQNKYLNVMPFYLLLIPVMGIAGFALVSSMSFQPGRIFMVITMVGILLSGITFYHLFKIIIDNKSKIKRIFSAIFLISFLISIFYLGLHMYYPSIEVYSYQLQDTKAEVSGMEFYFEKGSLDYEYHSLPVSPEVNRFAMLIYGNTIIPNQNTPQSSYQIVSSDLMYNFGYYEYESIGETITSLSYVLVDEIATMYAASYYSRFEYARHFYDNYHLEFDTSVNKIMSNRGVKFYLVT